MMSRAAVLGMLLVVFAGSRGAAAQEQAKSAPESPVPLTRWESWTVVDSVALRVGVRMPFRFSPEATQLKGWLVAVEIKNERHEWRRFPVELKTIRAYTAKGDSCWLAGSENMVALYMQAGAGPNAMMQYSMRDGAKALNLAFFSNPKKIEESAIARMQYDMGMVTLPLDIAPGKVFRQPLFFMCPAVPADPKHVSWGSDPPQELRWGTLGRFEMPR